MIATDPSGTDWTAVGSVVAAVSLVVGVLQSLANHFLARNQRIADAKERRRDRRVDRREREELFVRQVAVERRERLAKHYGAWFQALTACLLHKHDAFLAQARAAETRAEREKMMLKLDPRIPQDDAEVLKLRARVNHEQADILGEGCEALLQLVHRSAELVGIKIMIGIDENLERAMKVSRVTQAMESWDGAKLEDGQAILKQAEEIVGERVASFRRIRRPLPSKHAAAHAQT